MPDTDLEDVKRALGSICLIVDKIQYARNPKLDSVKPGSVDSYYMLAAFCFDAARKMEYMFKALRPFAERADPKLARDVKAHNDQMYVPDTTWEQRARRAEAVMLELYGQIGEDHENILNRVATGGGR